MPVSAIALYASSPSSVCSTTHPCSINTHSSHDLDLNSRSSSSAPSSASSSQKPPLGGLSCLLSSPLALSKLPPSAPSFPHNGEELSLWHDRGDELSSSCNYSHTSPLCSSSKRDQSPVSVFQGPFSSSSSVISSSRSSPVRALQEKGGDVSVYGSVRGGTSGLFNGFVRNALGSVVDCDPRRFKANSSTLLVDELTFDMEGFEEVEPEPYAKDLLLGAQLRHQIFYEEFVIKAFYEAERAHRGQMRASGDPYFQHCVETAVLLALVGASSIVVAAGLLHDTLDDSFMCYDDIFRTFGVGVADLVKGVSKLSQLSQLARKNNTASKTVEADRLHTMFLAMADARAVLIKLADRLHNMMTLDALPLVKRSRFAKETLEIFAPLANRLGIYNWKQQLENLCFKHLNPDEYRKLSSMVLNSYDEAMVTSATDKLEQALKDEGISYQGLARRHKSLYSIYCKMLKKKLTVDEIHDIHGLRLIVEKEEECYRALEVVCQLWLEVPGKFKDYITQPKYNGYRSLHTVVTGEGKVPFEVQIRTKEMHLQAEFGFAAHWRYKESDYEHSSFVLQMVEWARWVVTWQCEKMGEDQPSIGCATDAIKPPPCTFPSHSSDCPNSLPHTCDNGPVFVILMENDKMVVQEFPANATVNDLLERVGGRGSSRWLRYGFSVKEEFRLRVNHEPVSDPSCKLNMGDVVELSPAIPDKSLVEYREEIQRMYDGGLATSSLAGWKS